MFFFTEHVFLETCRLKLSHRIIIKKFLVIPPENCHTTKLSRRAESSSFVLRTFLNPLHLDADRADITDSDSNT